MRKELLLAGSLALNTFGYIDSTGVGSNIIPPVLTPLETIEQRIGDTATVYGEILDGKGQEHLYIHDADGIKILEFLVFQGENILIEKKVKDLGTTQYFTLSDVDDGEYSMSLRVVDTKGNITVPSLYKINVVDGIKDFTFIRQLVWDESKLMYK